ncbi:uroporphyrinogen-III synthase [Frankia sp. B2]|uniref:Uroporphyrinogen III synthase HEM4 n=2 Tax=Frankia casuarinae (strain DSM 45818 / CECT 9043 / HFP020203 / CcI3) TaxID=106370 RepID=Q2JEW5_FRACC|nr:MULTISPECIES: uroporphyrinogen-III synthase [Frankia]ABD10177.1 Uroporphyrinogen III synthase HEM4 [Frankia casuarinae]OFB44525.1 uroporphyrinogen-III synthase [Frankia sp. CgIM4]OHV47752.1 uroporphyrinogen-III synthase [Frankia sp. CgIS1]TFE32184.1 uroporphyrinogen-III synthase [Frankia sp. B2]
MFPASATSREPAVSAALPPLLGFTVGVTAARRRDELANLLERRGARVVHAPALRIVPLADDSLLLAATRECLTRPLDAVIATTAIGFRGWVEAAEGWGLGERLRDRLDGARLFTRGPKVTGAVRAAGLTECWSPRSESGAELVAHLLTENLAGLRIAVQLHGEPLPDMVEGLRAAGAEVVEIPVYRWEPPDDLRPVRRMVELIVTGGVSAVTFTSAPAVVSLLRIAREMGQFDELLTALRGEVLPACVGPVCAAPLERQGVATVTPDRFRLGALVRTLSDELPRRRVRTVEAAGHVLRVQGGAVIVNGEPVMLAPRTAAVLDALTERPGRVLSRAELLRRTGTAGLTDEHAVEMTVARLRTALGPAGCAVETVIKRGYRLAVV